MFQRQNYFAATDYVDVGETTGSQPDLVDEWRPRTARNGAPPAPILPSHLGPTIWALIG